MKRLIIALTSFVVIENAFSSEGLREEIYRRVALVYREGSWLPPRRQFDSVRGGDGFELGSVRKPFYELIPVVSNNFKKIVQDWGGYATNEVASYTVINAVCYSGTPLYLKFFDSLVSYYEKSGSAQDWEAVRFLLSPYRTPQRLTTTLMYEDATVRNLLERIRDSASRRGDSNVVERCEERLSGVTKSDYLELKAAGVEF